MMTVQFNAIGQNGYSLNGMSFENMTPGESSDDADQIMFWNPTTSGYQMYYLYSGEDADDGWYNAETDESFDDDYATGVPAGTTFWYYARGTGSGVSTTSGAVVSDDDVTFAITKGNYNMIASAYPTALKLNSIVAKGLTPGESSDDADQIMFWNPETSGYEMYYLYSGEDADDGWYNAETDESFDDDYPNGKTAGSAFWYYARGTGTGSVTFAK